MNSKAFNYTTTFKQHFRRHQVHYLILLWLYALFCCFMLPLWYVELGLTRYPCYFYELKKETPPDDCYRSFLSPPTILCLTVLIVGTALFAICVTLRYRQSVSHHGVYELTSFRHLDKRTAEIGLIRVLYLHKMSRRLQEEAKDEINALLSERSSILIGLEHPNLLFMPISRDTPHTNLKDFAFGESHFHNTEVYEFQFPPPYLTVIPILLRDVLKAVQFLHSRRIYHLNLQPKNILVLNTSGNEIGYQAKVGGFAFAKCSRNGKVLSKDIGVDLFKRFKKYLIGEDTKKELDGAKFDTWCIGLISFELFTGGMLTIGLKKLPISEILPPIHPPCSTFDSQVLNISFFVSAVKSRWTSDYDLEFWNGSSSDIYDLYVYFNFVSQCWNFTRGLILGRKRHGVKVDTIVNNATMRNVLRERQKPMIFIV